MWPTRNKPQASLSISLKKGSQMLTDVVIFQNTGTDAGVSTNAPHQSSSHSGGQWCWYALRTSQEIMPGWATLDSSGIQGRVMISHCRPVPSLHERGVERVPHHIHRDLGKPLSLLTTTNGKGGFKCGHRAPAQQGLGKAQVHMETKEKASGSGQFW